MVNDIKMPHFRGTVESEIKEMQKKKKDYFKLVFFFGSQTGLLAILNKQQGGFCGLGHWIQEREYG